ncbi:hypothetical protein EOD43_19850 [Sphingomonas crocodyli]|uniref:DUF6894 domain-containing protein n=2 Tax=Sphingomonas crocodyli TaxID=1979270 RepID=A0A437LYQ6_9SPHN|nr:hypothetical protein [Sphingomonas crocodyli]RVT90505.1 hypothetical protein EOD43_19850 [Sphingomonas crocodyli]
MIGIVFPDLHRAYIETCRSIPETARDLLIDGADPMVCAYLICDDKGRQLMEVPFADVLSTAEIRVSRGAGGTRPTHQREPARDEAALISFRQIFARANAGCILLTPELVVKDINEYGRLHSHTDLEAVRDVYVLDAFDLAGPLKTILAKFWTLPQCGGTAQLVDMPYCVLDAAGNAINGWWSARAWPLVGDDGSVIGLAAWGEPSVTPRAGGKTAVLSA